jgi:ferredoxin-nitrate reductase
MNIIKIHGFDLCSLGMSECPNSHEYEEIIFKDTSRGTTRNVYSPGSVSSAILIGDKSEFQEFKELLPIKLNWGKSVFNCLEAAKKQNLF